MKKEEKSKDIMESSKLVVFKDKRIRRIIHNKEWWFSVVDVITVLTDSERPRKYWSDLESPLCPKSRDCPSTLSRSESFFWDLPNGQKCGGRGGL